MPRQILYLDSYASDEAAELGRAGIVIHSASSTELLARTWRPEQRSPDLLVMRGGRLSPAEYDLRVAPLRELGFTPSTTEHSYAVAATTEMYEPVLGNLAPDSKTLDLHAPNILHKMWDQRWMEAVFVRSELGSVAKFDGVEACEIRTFSENEVNTAIQRIKDRFPDAKKLIVKRIERIRQVGGKNLEGRAVVLNSGAVFVDHATADDSNDGREFHRLVQSAAEEVSRHFVSNDVTGDYFVDIAERENGTWFVVELKPLLNGTIKNTQDLIRFLRAE